MNFVKDVSKDDDRFLYLKEKFPKLSEVKINERIFVDPYIRKLIKQKKKRKGKLFKIL